MFVQVTPTKVSKIGDSRDAIDVVENVEQG